VFFAGKELISSMKLVNLQVMQILVSTIIIFSRMDYFVWNQQKKALKMLPINI